MNSLSGLERELVCSICTEVLYQPVTVLDCLHTFCGSCLKEWFTHQRRKAETSRSRSAVENAYNCPTCRAVARDTQRNALVNNLLESFLISSPDRDRSEADKKEMREMYNPGENILPKVTRRKEHKHRRSEEAASRDRELLEEARQRSLQDMEEPRPRLISAGTLAPPQTIPADRSTSAEREQRRQRRRENGRMRETTIASLGSTTDSQDNHRRRSISPPVTSPRHPSAVEARQREHQMFRQASLRSIVSVSESATGSGESFDEARIMQEILAEGLLDGIDVDSLTEAEQDMWAERIAELYHARHGRQRSTTATVQNQQDDIAVQGRNTTETTSSIMTLEQSTSRARSRQRSDTTPVQGSVHIGEHAQSIQSRHAPTTPMTRSISNSSVTISHRTRTSDHSRLPMESSTETTPPMTRSVTDLSENQISSLPLQHGPSNEQYAALGQDRSLRASATWLQAGTGTAAQPRARPGVSPGRSPRLVQIIPNSPGQVSPRQRPVDSSRANAEQSGNAPITSPTPEMPDKYDEPTVVCFRCQKPNIQYDLHRHCDLCQVDLCMRCFREGRGCKHWFGFGHAADERFEHSKHKLEESGYPHKLIGRQYEKPPIHSIVEPPSSTTSTAPRARSTTSNPGDRLLEGYFCDRCGSFANDQFWLCDVCNEGEWGFCKRCVDTHHSCIHPLLPVSYKPTLVGDHHIGANVDHDLSHLSPRRPRSSYPTTPRSGASSTTTSHAGFNHLIINVTCDICRQSILPSHLRFHCPFHASGGRNTGNDFDLCTNCNYKLFVGGRPRSDGPEGWRKCPEGHRMIMLNFEADSDGGMRRYIKHDLVGGWKLTEEDMLAFNLSRTSTKTEPHSPPSVSPRGTWTWREDSAATRRGTRSRQNSLMQGSASPKLRFPPEGGIGGRGVAVYSYWPEDGEAGAGELRLPKGAEVTEIEDINGDWLSGVYAGDVGVFPYGFVRWS